MKTKIVLAGGTGFVGSYLEQKFIELGYEVIIISRKKEHINWDDMPAITRALENAEMLINLAGKSVNCRYNEKNKQEILDSRVNTTHTLAKAVLACSVPPALWINSSTATIYRHAQDRPMREDDGEIGEGFSVHVATSWEEAFFMHSLPRTRRVALRMAIVLGKNGGVMEPMKKLVRFGLGGKQGSGKQKFSWIHQEDLFNIIMYINEHTKMEGVFNASAPNPVGNEVLMRTLRRQMNIPAGLPAPVWLLKAGAVIIHTETELILKSRWVLPGRLLQAGFRFTYDDLGKALHDIIKG